MLKKRLLSLSIAVVFALTTVTLPAYADKGGHGKGNEGKGKGKPAFVQEKKEHKAPKINFNKPVTNLEAIKAAMDVYLVKNNIADVKVTDKNVLGLALKYNIIAKEDFKNKNFAKTPAKRYLVATYFARALNLTTSNTFTFTDANAIPKNALPYVYAMVDNKLMAVNADGAFQPNKPVTYSELLLIVAGKPVVTNNPTVSSEVKGSVAAVDNTNHKLVIKKYDNKLVVLDIPTTAKIRVNSVDKTNGDLTGIAINMSVEVKLENKVVVSVEAKDAAAPTPTPTPANQITGVFKSVDPSNSRVIVTVGTTDITYYFNGSTIVKKDGVATVLTDATLVGLNVTVKFAGTFATEILATSAATVTTTGAVDIIDNAAHVLTVKKTDNSSVAFFIPTTATITVNGTVKTAQDLTSIVKNMNITVITVNGVVTTVTANDTIATVTTTGTVDVIDNTAHVLTVKKTDNSSVAFFIPATATITVNGIVKTAQDLASIVKNMNITVITVNGVVTAVTATDNITEVTGVLAAVDSVNYKLYVTVGTTTNNYAYDANTLYKNGDAFVTSISLISNNVKLTIKNNIVTMVVKN